MLFGVGPDQGRHLAVRSVQPSEIIVGVALPGYRPDKTKECGDREDAATGKDLKDQAACILVAKSSHECGEVIVGVRFRESTLGHRVFCRQVGSDKRVRETQMQPLEVDHARPSTLLQESVCAGSPKSAPSGIRFKPMRDQLESLAEDHPVAWANGECQGTKHRANSE
jgi:hypothetical protein